MQNNTQLSPALLVELMETNRYGAEYQPIIDIKTQEIYAFESLARFFDSSGKSIRPDLVFSSLHYSPLSLFQVEYQQKKLQLSFAPKHKRLFINLDQDSYFSAGLKGEDNPFLTLFNDYSGTITVELIENSEINDALMSLAMIDVLLSNNISTAIDDVCNPQSMISTSVIQLVNYVKLDKYVVKNKNNPHFLYLVKAIVNYAHISGKKIILEGVETDADLHFAKKINVDFVQGFLYKDKFINVTI